MCVGDTRRRESYQVLCSLFNHPVLGVVLWSSSQLYSTTPGAFDSRIAYCLPSCQFNDNMK